MKKPNIKEIAAKLHDNGVNSYHSQVSDLASEALINAINEELSQWTEEVIAELENLEHPQPENKAEYDEMLGFDDDYRMSLRE